MTALYNEERFAALKKQIGKRQTAVLLTALLFLAGLILLLALDDHRENRPAVPATLLTVFGGSAIVFLWDLTVRPLRSYAKHQDAALHGRTHETVAVFDRFGTEDSVIDGITYRDLIFLGEADKHGERERMFYWDMELPLPSFTQGQEIRLTYFDRFLSGYETL